MRILRRVTVAVLVIAALGFATEVLAEVSAEVDAFGNYVRTVVLSNASVKNIKIWSVSRARPQMFPLNPSGDLNGDLWPTIAENPYNLRHPWVLWSRFNGVDYDLVWSRWFHGGWSPIEWVQSSSGSGDDIDPSVAFSSEGRPHGSWWRLDENAGSVYYSMFLSTQWMDPILVSDPGVDSRDPVVTVLPDGRIQIEFSTPDGRVLRIIVINRSQTITDDIDPFSTLTLEPLRPAPGPTGMGF
jgi:hypothetical protein